MAASVVCVSIDPFYLLGSSLTRIPVVVEDPGLAPDPEV